MTVNMPGPFFFQHPPIEDAMGKIDKICCICFTEENVRNLKSHKWNETFLFDILKYCLPLQDFTKEWCPPNICESCLYKLIHTYIFLSKASSALLIIKRNVTGYVDELIEAACAVDSDSENMTDEEVVDESTKKEIEKSIKPMIITNIYTGYKCNTCGISYRKLKDFRSHLLELHPLDTRLMCELCGKFFNTPISLSAHKRTHNDNKKYMCDKCGKDLKTPNSLRVHVNEIHLMKEKSCNQLCPVCGKKFIRSNSLLNHMRTHTKEKPYECGICGSCFSVKQNLYRHTMAHKGLKPYKCHLCEKGFTQKVNLNVHVRNCHLNLKPIKCKYCLLHFDHEYELESHIVTKHKEADEICKNDSLVNGCKCTECGKSFKSKSCLMQHLSIHTGIKNYKCSTCDKSFRLGIQLKVHMLTHTNEKPHKCEHCEMAFRQKSHLTYHMVKHEGKKSHICPYCDKGFNLKGNLKVHIRIHTGDTPYVCQICNRGFNDSNGLKRHARSNHLIQVTVPVEEKVTIEENVPVEMKVTAEENVPVEEKVFVKETVPVEEAVTLLENFTVIADITTDSQVVKRAN